MTTVVTEDGQISIPAWVVDLESFRRWVDSNDFPEHADVWWLCGEVWADMSKEQIFTHLAVKAEIYSVVTSVVKIGKFGLFLSHGALLSNFTADISGNPDGVFLSTATMQSDRIRFIAGREGGYTELQGSPDMALEILSKSSEHKDLVVLRQAYWEAEIREYWLVDARQEPLSIGILHHTARGYSARRKKEGWVKSEVFGKSFRLTQSTNALGHPEYALEVR